MAKGESKVFIDPWGAILIEDYIRVINQFGLEPFTDETLKKIPNPNRLMRRKIIFCHRDLNIILDAMKSKKPFYALTGIMPSAQKIHFGTKMVVENLKYFQDQGAITYLLVADLEAASTRGISLKESRKNALEFHIPAYIALGIDPEKTTFYFQSENKDVMRLMCILSNKVTESEFRAIYGSVSPGKVIAALLDVSDVLFPQFRGKPMPGVIPVGIDQDPHIRLTRDLARKTKRVFGFVPPAAVYHKFTPSLDGSFKMSKSKPETYIELPEEPESISRKLWNAFTGGRETLEKQKRLGGVPEKCVIFEFFKQHLIEKDEELDKIYFECKSGALICGDCKHHAIELMSKFMNEFNRKLEKARDLIPSLNFIK